jgi:hypothetical protein
MEDYVARDDRPAKRCLVDVAQSDLYVGLFAWRYGFIPKAQNPKSLSITQLEYREAERRKIPRLIFMLDEAAAWPPNMLDSHTGDAGGGRRIREFRRELSEDRLASFFTSPEDLAAKVSASIHLASTVASASDASFDLAGIVGADAIDKPEILFNASNVTYLLHRVAQLGGSPILKIDLRDGKYWWSTRLYALAILAVDYTAVEWLIFVERGSDYVGMVHPRDLRRAMATAHPAYERAYQQAHSAPALVAMSPPQRAGMILNALVSSFAQSRGGEKALRFFVSPRWVLNNVPGLTKVRVECPGPFDPLATFELLQTSTPFVPVTDGPKLIKVVDRVGVATEIAKTVLQRQLGRK